MSSPDAQASTPSDGVLAQLVEHRTFNPLVIGSNPIHPTIFLVDPLPGSRKPGFIQGF
jgi:hypothetical protein